MCRRPSDGNREISRPTSSACCWPASAVPSGGRKSVEVLGLHGFRGHPLAHFRKIGDGVDCIELAHRIRHDVPASDRSQTFLGQLAMLLGRVAAKLRGTELRDLLIQTL